MITTGPGFISVDRMDALLANTHIIRSMTLPNVSDQPLPGDEILYQDDTPANVWGVIKLVKWQEAPKGGKVAVYELVDGTIVPLESVKDHRKVAPRPSVEMVAPPQNVIEDATKQMRRARRMMADDFVEELFLPSQLKTAISCVIVGDVENLKIARFLIDQEIKKVTEIVNEP